MVRTIWAIGKQNVWRKVEKGKEKAVFNQFAMDIK